MSAPARTAKVKPRPAPGPAQPAETPRGERPAITAERLAGLTGAATLWELLTEYAGCCVAVYRRDGRVVYANRGSRAWIKWRQDRSLTPTTDRPDHISQSCSEEMVAERHAYVRRVCDERVSLAYESINNGLRDLVSLSPVPDPDGEGVMVLAVSRRLRPWERVTADVLPGAIIVQPKVHDPGPLGRLSPRELQVLILVGEGHTYTEIGEMLGRSRRTVERHRDQVCRKLGISSRIEMARWAIRAGLAEPCEPREDAMLSQIPYDPLSLSPAMVKIANKRVRTTGNLAS